MSRWLKKVLDRAFRNPYSKRNLKGGTRTPGKGEEQVREQAGSFHTWSSLSTRRMRTRSMESSGDVQQGGRFMLKATLRCAVLLALVAFGMAMTSVPSFAEVQNVKVGGDVTVRAFHRESLDLRQEKVEAQDEDDFIMQTTGFNVCADLTENVAANISITNERDWDQTVGEGSEIALSQ